MIEPASPQPDWIARWQRIARRIRVPLGFLAAALYLFELLRRAPHPAAVAWSLALVLPGLWLRAYASGYRQKESANLLSPALTPTLATRSTWAPC